MMLTRLHSFYRNDQGGVAAMFGLALVPILIAVGASVDYARVATARTAAQAAADSAALGVASTAEGSKSDLERLANRFAEAKLVGTLGSAAKLSQFSYNEIDRTVKVVVTGQIKSSILGIVGIDTMAYSATARAVRATQGSVELVLVLDNTWSMNGEKLDALKSASTELVKLLKEDPKADVKIGLVPYADYVNVGVENRYKSWVSVPADYSNTSARTCKTQTTKQTCKKTGPQRSCTRVVDGIPESYDCTASTCTTEEVPPYESCSGGGTTKYTWYGCVGSRIQGDLRRSDLEPATAYPGFLATSQNCLNPIVPLTDSKSTLVTALQGMIVNVGGYRPLTYIPAGLIWGLNLLSPTEPFTQGAAYDAKNRAPRKALVLMSDGANTLRFDPKTGRHVTPSTDASSAQTQLGDTVKDMLAICDTAKARKIEVFTILFDTTDPGAKSAMSSCATSAAHSADAKSKTELMAAFKNIARSLTSVRLTH
jgi:Flp pilus assembly protein TadG